MTDESKARHGNANAVAGLKAYREREAVTARALEVDRLADPAQVARYAESLSNALAVAFLAGDGLQAPGAIVLRTLHGWQPFAVHFLNLQSGGYHAGDYNDSREGGLAAFADKLRRYDPTGGLNAAATAQGLTLETVSALVESGS